MSEACSQNEPRQPDATARGSAGWTIVGFGASTMQGAGDTQGGCFARLKLAGATLGAQWINCGIGGDTTRQMLQRAPAVAAHHATHLVVLLGCNDLPRSGDPAPDMRTTLDEYAQNLDRLLPAIRAPRSLFVTSFAVAPRVGINDDDFARYVAAAADAARRHGYELWDLYGQTLQTISRYWAPDGVHLAGAGHQFVADGAWRWLTRP